MRPASQHIPSGWAWLLLGLALGLPAALTAPIPLNQPLASWPVSARAWALQPDQGWSGLALAQLWTCTWLHGSSQHLLKNLAALLLLVSFGLVLRANGKAALAWLLSWPLTHLGMLGQPLTIYVGMSGVLHAGFVIVAISTLWPDRTKFDRHQKISAWILFFGLILKIVMENPWQHVLIQSVASDINVAPWAHLSGAVAGAVLYISIRLLPSGRQV